MTLRQAGIGAATAAAGLLLASATVARAQQPDLEPLARPITVWVADRPPVSVTFTGEHGSSTLLGTLESAPRDPVRVTDSSGQVREVPFQEVAALSTSAVPYEGIPAGAFVVSLFSNATVYNATRGYGGSGGGGDFQGRNLLRAMRLPEGSLVLTGAPYTRITVPLARVTRLERRPLTGTLAQLPAGMLRMELFPGATVQVPLPSVELMYRDLKNGTITVQLASDGPNVQQQTLTGKLVDLPNVNLELGEAPNRQVIPLARVVALQRPGLGAGGSF